jgi:DNA-binding MarR family transcriptional regulator
MSNELTRLMRVLEAVRQHDMHISVAQLQILIYVGEHPDCTIMEAAEAVNLPTSTASRHIAELGRGISRNSPGLELIESSENPDNRRERLVQLTRKGGMLLNTITQLLK